MPEDAPLPPPTLPLGNPPPPQRVFLPNVSLSDLTVTQRGFVVTIRRIEEDITPTTTGREVQEMVVEALPPEALFHDELLAVPTLYRDLRNWLVGRGVPMGQHPSRRVLHIVAEHLYEDRDDKSLANELAKAVLRARRPAPAAAAGAANPAPPDSGAPTTRALCHQLNTRYRDDTKKFSGLDGEAFHEHVATYQQLTRCLGATQEQRLELMFLMLAGEAKRFYDEHVHGCVVTFSEAVQLITEQFNPEITQTQTHNELSLLRWNHYVKQGKTELQAIRELYKTVSRKAPLFPLAYRSDRHKKDFLRHALVGVAWAEPVINRCESEATSFQKMYAELAGALQLNLEGRQVNELEAAIGQKPMPIQYAGQGTYGRPSKGVDAPRPAGGGNGGGVGSGGRKFDPLTITGCFNCDAKDHLMKDCKRPIDFVKIADEKLAYWSKKRGGKATAAAVLYAMADQMNQISTRNAEAAGCDGGDESGSVGEDEQQLFQALLARGVVGDASDGAVGGVIVPKVGTAMAAPGFQPGA